MTASLNENDLHDHTSVCVRVYYQKKEEKKKNTFNQPFSESEVSFLLHMLVEDEDLVLGFRLELGPG